MHILLRLTFLVAVFSLGWTQECPTNWDLHDGMCYYFSEVSTKLTFTAAESFCLQNNGHLVSFLTVDERDWVARKWMLGPRPQTYYIGLTDSKEENVFRWTDGNDLDPEVRNFQLGEPNNIGVEHCVEVAIKSDPRLAPIDAKWNDISCNYERPFACKRPTGSVSQCPDGWTLSNGRCYQVVASMSSQWFEASDECKARGGDLVAISSSTEEYNVENLVRTYNTPFWIGLSDTVTPGVFAWSDTVTTYSYNNWANGQPPTTLPWKGSTCAAINNNLGFKWDTNKCSDERPFICERGLKANCPNTWLYGYGKCYDFVINPSRVMTWTEANRACQAVGAGLIKIESEDQQNFVATALEGYLTQGQREIWMGISDIGHDENLLYWDKSPVNTNFWDGTPATVPGRDDCANIYTGGNGNNWEITSCFLQLGFICELPEGKEISSGGSITVEGKCNDGWRHYLKSCYYFSGQELSQSNAQTNCRSSQAELTTIVDESEQSFLVGHLQSKSWIGLTKSGSNWVWPDGTTAGFVNWLTGQPDGQSCVNVDEVGLWSDDDCNKMMTYVCKKDEVPTDPRTVAPPTYVPDLEKCGGDGWISDPQLPNCYKVYSMNRAWRDARVQCQKESGDLASINFPNEQAFLETIAKGVLSAASLWVGGNDITSSVVTDQGWSWSDGTPFNYINWNSGEPNNAANEDCMEIRTGDGLWNDLECTKTRGFICEKVGNAPDAVPGDVADDNCGSNEACCFKNIGCEYRGIIPDSAFTASTEKDQWFVATRGRLNTPADVIILSIPNEIYVGTGHGAWEPTDSDPNPYLQVDLPTHYELKGIVTQGRNGLLKHEEMQWTKTYKVSYSQDASDSSSWQFILDSETGNAKVFDGNFDQNTAVTNFFPRPIVARHMRCHPMDYRHRRALRLEYIGCKASCLHKIGMNSGYIPNDKITATSSKSGHDASQARPPVDSSECLANSNDNGANYRGWIARTKSGLHCQPWNSQTPHPHSVTAQNYPQAGLVGDYCRNPNGKSAPYCYTVDSNVETEECDIPVCPSYTPQGWSPTSTSNQWIQVQFDTHYKVSAITLYNPNNAGQFLTEYTLSFSDDGSNFLSYVNADDSVHAFRGLKSGITSYMDVLIEPIATVYLKLYPKTWYNNQIGSVQFEVNGCYVDGIISCSETGTNFLTEDTYVVQCPAGCLRDAVIDPVYGTDVYTSNSAICPSAIHAGKANDNLGGTIFVTNREGQLSYAGSYRNGITSDPYGAYPTSFSFTGYSLRCEDGWFDWNENCYYYSPKGDIQTWQSARATCLSMGADLVSITSSGENDFVESLLVRMENPGDDAWLGMSDLDTQNYYLWADGSPVTFTKWFFREPNSKSEHCVQMYIIDGYWNDRECDALESYICKRPKTFMPAATTIFPPTDAGCDVGWTAYGPSCYRVSQNELIQQYAVIHCADMESRLVSIHDDYEQAFVHSLVTTSLPSFSGYTAWIGITAHTDVQGGQYFSWQGSQESVSYTHWDKNEPDALLQCTFPFVYKGVTYYECTTTDNPLAINGVAWCSIDPIWTGRLIYCGNDNPQACTYMDDRTGYWNTELCIKIRYYVCEKNRVGYTQPVQTTVDPRFKCADGWYGNENTSDCYQINDMADRAQRLTWQQAQDQCAAQKADLVSIHSYIEENAIIDFVSQKGVFSYTSFWLGLNEINPDYGYGWSDGTPVSYTNWADGEPNDHNSLENCAESQLMQGSAWNDINCDAPRNWVCKISKRRTPSPPPTIPPPQGEETSECGSDTTWIKFAAPDGIARCYHFETETMHGWPSAENECMKLGGHLMSMHSVEEKTFALSRIARSGKEVFWIGLRDVAERQFLWSDSSPLNYVNWAPGEPNDYMESEGCAEMGAHDGNWNDDNCGIQQPYICMKNIGDVSVTIPPTPIPEGNCPTGYYRYGNKCWLYGGLAQDERLTWYDAKERCENMSSTLAVVENEYEQAFISSLMYYIGRNAWIGMWGSMYNPYVWVDESVVRYVNWASGQPDYPSTSCVRMNYASQTAGQWNDDDCNGLNAFICFKKVSTDYPKPEATPPPENCPSGYKLFGNACFKVMTGSSSWETARTTCQNDGKGVDLASINEGFQNNMLKSMFWRDVPVDSVWIGMKYKTTTTTPEMPVDSVTQPTLTETVFTWSDGWPVEYTNWGVGQPNTDVSSNPEGCVFMTKSGSWNVTSSCDKSMAFVCKKSLVPIPTPPSTPAPLEGDCDPGFEAFGPYCYYIERGIYTVDTRSFGEARMECEYRGAELASFHSESECVAIVDMIIGGSHNLWIGLTHDGFSGWRWIDQTPVDYFNWVPGEPNGVGRGEVCVELYPWNGQWNDVDCFQGRGYICRMHKKYAYCGVVPLDFRQDCGYTGIDEGVCLRRGCCWDETVVNTNFSGCFYPENYDFGTREPVPSSGLSGGAIAGIVIGIVLLVGVIGAAIFITKSGKSISMADFTFGGGSSNTTTKENSGFDNPAHAMGGESSEG